MPRVLTPFRVKPPQLTAVAGSILELAPLLQARDIYGKDEPFASVTWKIQSGNMTGARIGKTTGRLVVRPLPGTMVIRATHASGDYCLCTITVTPKVSGGDTDPPEEPEDPPPPPPPPPARLEVFAYGVEPAGLGPYYTMTLRAMNPEIIGEIDLAASRGGAILGRQGGKQFLDRNGELDEGLIFAWLEGFAPYAAALGAHAKAGRFPGLQLSDDFRSTTRWPPKGFTEAIQSRVAAHAKDLYPWLKVGHRARPSQYTSTVPAPVDFVICQYKYSLPQTPAQFWDAEFKLADARGWDVYWSLNVPDGGTRWGTPMTPQQIRDAALAFLAVRERNRGIGWWANADGHRMLQRPEYQAVLAEIKEMV